MIKSVSQYLAPASSLQQLNISHCLISGDEDSEPLVNDLILALHNFLPSYSNRLSCNADRYFDFSQLSELVQSNSLFGDKNFIEIRFKTKPGVEQQKQIEALLPQLGDGNFLCLCCTKLDKKDLGAVWLKNWQLGGDIVLLNTDLAEVRQWVAYRFQQYGKSCDAAGIELLIEMNQGNLVQLYQEINKLALFSSVKSTISYQDVNAQIVDNVQYNVFALGGAYLTGNPELTRRIFANVCQTTEDAILVIWNVAEDLRRLLRIRAALKANPQLNFMQAIEGLRIWGEAVSSFRVAHERLGYGRLLDSFEHLARIDCIIKGVKPGDALIELEKLLITICRGAY